MFTCVYIIIMRYMSVMLVGDCIVILSGYPSKHAFSVLFIVLYLYQKPRHARVGHGFDMDDLVWFNISQLKKFFNN